MKGVIFIINRDFNDGDNFTGNDVDLIVANINANETSINNLSTNKVDKVAGKSLSTNDFDNIYKTKLDGIENGAEVNNISDVNATDLTDTTDTSLHYHSSDRNRSNHTGTQSASTIVQDANNRFTTDVEKNTWNNKIDSSKIGVANGVAQTDSNGLVVSSQLPSYVDDVLEYTSNANFPATGESGKIYLDTFTNITYRWSGTVYVEISPSIALGETSSTAYSGDKGKTTTDNVNSHITDGVKHITSAERITWNDKQNTIVNPTVYTAELQSGWINYDSTIQSAGYYKTIENVVYIKGLIKNGLTTNPTLLFTLLEGFRPSKAIVTTAKVTNGVNLALAQINIGTDGQVNLCINSGYNGWLSLEGISFPTF